MDVITPYLQGAYEFLYTGYGQVNEIQGLVIALVAVVVMKEWKRIWFVAFGALMVHLIVDTLRPVLDGKDLKLPNLVAAEFWISAAGLYLGFLIVTAVFFFVKKHVLKA